MCYPNGPPNGTTRISGHTNLAIGTGVHESGKGAEGALTSKLERPRESGIMKARAGK